MALSPHVRAQVWRFARTSALAFVSSLAATGGRVSWASLWVMLVGAGEVGWREVYPVRALPDRITSVLSPAAGPGLGLPEVPPGVVVSTPQTYSGVGTPMQGVQGVVGQTATVSNPPPGVPPGAAAP